MKRNFALLIALCIFVSGVSGYALLVSAEQPILIETPAQFDAIRNNLSGNYVLNNNITLPSTYVPIVGFSGTLIGVDGCNKIDVSITGTTFVGLFATITGGVVENIIVGGTITGETNVGGIAGLISGAGAAIRNCRNEATITVGKSGSVAATIFKVGGIAGETLGVSATAGEQVVISGSSNHKTITHTGLGQYIGGVVGYINSYTNVLECFNNGAISGGHYVGGVAGFAEANTAISYCYNTASVQANSGYAAGLIGFLKGALDQSFNSGNVSASSHAAGLVLALGASGGAGAMSNCFNSGRVSAGGSAGIGVGLVQSISSHRKTIKNLYNVGIVTALSTDRAYPTFANVTHTAVTITDIYYLSTLTKNAGEYINSVAKTAEEWSKPLSKLPIAFQDESVWMVLPLSAENKYPFPQLVEAPFKGTYDTFGLVEDPVNFAGGKGTKDSPFIIRTIDHLKNISLYPSANYSQEEDIIDEITEPIGEFSGEYNGEGHFINVRINDLTKTDQGLFTKLTNAKIYDVVIDGEINGHTRIGGIAGSMSGTTYIKGCVNKAKIFGRGNYVGGLVGSSTTTASPGTIVGFESCVNEGAISANASYVGGIVGSSSSADVINLCSNSGNIGSAVAVNLIIIGGIAGLNQGAISNSYNMGRVSISKEPDGYSQFIGGIAGQLKSTGALITNCYNTGEIIGTNGAGIVLDSADGKSGIRVSNSYHIGKAAYPITNGDATSSIKNCYYLSIELKSDGIDSSATSTQDPTVPVLLENIASISLSNDFSVNPDSEIYPYPQLTENPHILSFHLGTLTVVMEGDEEAGSLSFTGTMYFNSREERNINIIPAQGYYIEFIKLNGTIVMEGYRGEVTYQVPFDEQKELIVSLKPLLSSAPLLQSALVAYSPAEEEAFFIDETTSIQTYGIAFATIKNIYQGYTIKEYGMLFSSQEALLDVAYPVVDGKMVHQAPAELKQNGLGQYGICFYGSGVKKGTTYYTKAYAIYSSLENPEERITVYGEEINSFTPKF